MFIQKHIAQTQQIQLETKMRFMVVAWFHFFTWKHSNAMMMCVSLYFTRIRSTIVLILLLYQIYAIYAMSFEQANLLVKNWLAKFQVWLPIISM